MQSLFRGVISKLIAVVAAVLLGCTERTDLAPVLRGHQRIDEAFSNASHPPAVAGGAAQGRSEMPPAGDNRASRPSKIKSSPPKSGGNPMPNTGASVAKASGNSKQSAVRNPAKDSHRSSSRTEEKAKPKTIASNRPVEKRIIPSFGRGPTAGRKDKAEERPAVPAGTAAKGKEENASLRFGWPLAGSVVKNYSQTGNKGIRIAGKKGQKVKAAEAGKVVYSGQGLIGYGNLLIIKHNDQYLTAYANNSTLLAREGDSVRKGQGIATVGASHKAMLHFEIRKHGKSVNPLALLPKL